MTSNDLITYVVNAGSKIHKALGAGLLQEIYEECLVYELAKKEINAERQKVLPLEFEQLKFEKAFIVDLFVEKKLVVGIKPENVPESMFRRKIESYVKLCGFSTGLIIDFNVDDFRSGVRVLEKAFKPLSPPIIGFAGSYGKYYKR